MLGEGKDYDNIETNYLDNLSFSWSMDSGGWRYAKVSLPVMSKV
jgi:hypothetical protein